MTDMFFQYAPHEYTRVYGDDLDSGVVFVLAMNAATARGLDTDAAVAAGYAAVAKFETWMREQTLEVTR